MAESFTYIFSSICFVAFFFVSYFSFAWAETEKGKSETDEKLSKKEYVKLFAVTLKRQFKALSFVKWLCIFALAAAATGTVVSVQLRGMHLLFVAKIIVCLIVLICAAVVDAYTHTIPNILSIILIVARLIFIPLEYVFQKDNFKILLIASAIGLIATFLVLYFVHRITKRGFGMGDVKILSSLGFSAGITSCLVTVLFGMVLAAVLGIILILLKKKNRKDVVPFGPFIYIGFVISVALGVF